jgi:hypothetical protein
MRGRGDARVSDEAAVTRSQRRRRKKKKARTAVSDSGLWGLIPGSDLLSHKATLAVPSAVEGLTSVFGMGTGVTPLLWPPGNLVRSMCPVLLWGHTEGTHRSTATHGFRSRLGTRHTPVHAVGRKLKFFKERRAVIWTCAGRARGDGLDTEYPANGSSPTQQSECGRYSQASRLISTSKLNVLPRLHIWPITW